jgi:hypothetical protein
MRCILLVGATLIFGVLPAFPQSASGFVYGAAGGELTRYSGHSSGDALLHLGGGGEYVTRSGIGIEADGGVLGVLFGGTRGTFSVGGSYHFRRKRMVDPFVTAGYSFFSQTGAYFLSVPTDQNVPHLNLFNAGGGMNLWFSRHVGARIEIRDHLNTVNGGTIQFPEFLLGLGLR